MFGLQCKFQPRIEWMFMDAIVSLDNFVVPKEAGNLNTIIFLPYM